MIKFEKVPFEEYLAARKELGTGLDALVDLDPEAFYNRVKEEYDDIKLPSRGTAGSAGYDFYAPFDVYLRGFKAETGVANAMMLDAPVSVDYGYITLPTGIRWICDREDLVLLCLPRSGLGARFGTHIRNTLGAIDCDYFGAKNYGHIKLTICSEIPCTIEKGKGIMQGIIIPFFRVDDDNVEAKREGGFGSTTK